MNLDLQAAEKTSHAGRMPLVLLRLEGAAVFLVATLAYFRLGNPWWAYLVFLLAPDIAALGYLGGPRLGSITYNLAHFSALPLALGVVGWWLGSPVATAAALIWLAHIGIDRFAGYGLKYADRFKHTHFDQL